MTLLILRVQCEVLFVNYISKITILNFAFNYLTLSYLSKWPIDFPIF